MDYTDSPWVVREDLVAAHRRAWLQIAKPGSWWLGSERVAIAAACRASEHCTTCARQRDSLSPGPWSLVHESGHPELGDLTVTVVHRVRQDASRLTRSAVHALTSEHMSDGAYVELVGIVATVVAIDSFADVLGLERWALPVPQAGEPDRYRPEGLDDALAWVPVIDPDRATGLEADIYANQSAANIHRALTLVPREKRGFFDLDDVMYLPDAQLRDFANEYRAIDHRQIELIAARVSAINQCHY